MNRSVAFVVSAMFSAACFAEVAPGDWPQFRGPGAQGASAEKGLPVTWSQAENVAWKVDLPGPGSSTPVIVGKRIFLTCYTGYNVPRQEQGSPENLKRHALCLDRDSGKTIWEKSFQAELPEQAKIRDDHGYASNTPVADDRRLYCFFGKSGVVALDLADGREVWRAPVGNGLNGWGSGASLVLAGGNVIVNASVESSSLIALDKNTGKEAWRAGGIKEAWNTPVVVNLPGGASEIVVPIMQKILAFDPQTGKQLWSCDTDIRWYMVPCVVAHEGVVYCIGGRSGGALAVKAGGRGDVTGSHRIWTGTKGSNVSSPVFHDGHVYWMNENNRTAYCADARTGKVVYEQQVGGRFSQVYAPALLADGKVYYTTRDGKIIVIAAKPQFEQVAFNDLSDRSTFNAGIAVSGGRLFVRSDKALYCVWK
ncbi:MAG TPA: PQQ-binding-like beta-propeller repeat protein [Tepidisphaeraceae bacterium]|nr:PQQ-binding-like beta-propeller repeat protein [Tepidisphaeraceae bacterium]